MTLVFGAPPGTNSPIKPGLEYLRDLQLHLSEVHNFARQCQVEAGVKQKWVYDYRCQGCTFSAGAYVWVYCPFQKKGVSPKLTS